MGQAIWYWKMLHTIQFFLADLYQLKKKKKCIFLSQCQEKQWFLPLPLYTPRKEWLDVWEKDLQELCKIKLCGRDQINLCGDYCKGLEYMTYVFSAANTSEAKPWAETEQI